MTNQNFLLIWEIPLALLSFVFYKVMKFIIGNLFILYLAINKEKACQWRVLSEENLKSPLALPVLMTKGPRWNTHAIIGTLGPFSVKQSIAIDVESANNSAQSWIAVVYSFPGYKTIASLESAKVTQEKQWISLQLKPGKYTLGLRYYGWSNSINLPSIKVDEEYLTKSQPVAANINDFYYGLIKQKNWFYLSLHYYIFTVLRLRKWLPESFVKGEYLPVGAPGTEFFYGYLNRGQSLQIAVDSLIVNNYNIYYTLYDRSSFPLNWCQIQQENMITDPIDNNGFYLIRIRPKETILEKLGNKLSFESQLYNKDDLTQELKITVSDY